MRRWEDPWVGDRGGITPWDHGSGRSELGGWKSWPRGGKRSRDVTIMTTLGIILFSLTQG